MNIFIDIETLRPPETHRLQIIDDVKDNFKAPSTLTKAKAAIDLGITDKDEIKFTGKDAMIARWESELAESKSADFAQGIWEKTSFNPDVAPIACICIIANGERREFSLTQYLSEDEMLFDFHTTINSMCFVNGVPVKKPNFIGHNISKFDLPFIWKRSVINDVKCCEGVKWVDARHGSNCYDTMIAWAGFGNRISADDLCKLLNIKGKTEGMDGSLVYDTWQVDPQKVIDYCHDDVQMVKDIYERLTK